MNLSKTLDKHLSEGNYFSFMANLTRKYGKAILSNTLDTPTNQRKSEQAHDTNEMTAISNVISTVPEQRTGMRFILNRNRKRIK